MMTIDCWYYHLLRGILRFINLIKVIRMFRNITIHNQHDKRLGDTQISSRLTFLIIDGHVTDKISLTREMILIPPAKTI